MPTSRVQILRAHLALLEVMLDDDRYSARTVVLIDKAAIAVENLIDQIGAKEARVGARGRASAN